VTNPFHYIRLLARSTGDPRLLERPIRAAVRAIDPAVAIFHVQPMQDYVASWLAQRRLALALMTTFGGLALLLSAIGIYALLAYSVILRTRELGIRAALGATARDLLTLIMWRGLALTGVGLATGVLLAAGTTRLAGSLLFGISALDVITLALSGLVIVTTGVLACVIPARRASAVSPAIALRQ
jgi:ABC-type antimicrobial peptide transport system permease subunit